MEATLLVEQKERIPTGHAEDFHPDNQDLRQWIERNFAIYGDIFSANLFGTNVYVISSPEHVEHVLRHNWDNYKKGQAIKRVALLLGSGLMVSEGEFWKQQRRMIQPAFTHGFVSLFYTMMKNINQTLLEKWDRAAEQNECVNVTSDLSLMVLEVTLRAIFGADYPAIAPFFSFVHDDSARNLQFAQKFAELRNLVLEIVERRRKAARAADEKPADILFRLMQARDPTGKPMPDNQLVNEIMTIVIAGHETTASTLNMTWYLLSQNVKVEKRLAAELETLAAGAFPGIEELPSFSYTRKVIDEALRLYPAGWLLTRRAKKNDRLGDYFIPAGTEIYISPYILHRRTCHDTHTSDFPKMLRAETNALCLSCHGLNQPGVAVNMSAQSVTLLGGQKLSLEEYGKAKKIGPDISGRGAPPIVGHPVKGKDPRGKETALSCLSCHSPHGSANRSLVLKPASGGKAENLCLSCHGAITAQIAKSKQHPAVDAGCDTCHSLHKSGPAGTPEGVFHLTKAQPELCLEIGRAHV